MQHSEYMHNKNKDKLACTFITKDFGPNATTASYFEESSKPVFAGHYDLLFIRISFLHTHDVNI